MTEHRNTPRNIVFDMEDDIGDLRRLGATALLLAGTDGLEDVVQDALHHVARNLIDCHRDLHDKFTRLFDQIVRANADESEQLEGFSAIFAAWNTNRRQRGEGPHGMSDEQAERLNEEETALLNQLIAAPATNAGEIVAKVFVAKKMIEESGSSWSDARDVRVLDSVMADLEKLP